MNWVFGLQWSLIGLFLLLSAFFSSSETALFALDDMKIQRLGNKDARKRIKTLLKSSSLLLITILLGNTLVNTATSSLLENKLLFENPLITTLVVTATLLFFGEITPKTIALMQVEQMAIMNSWILHPFFLIMKPVSRLIDLFSNGVLTLLKKLHKKTDHADHDHLSALLSIVSREKLFDDDEKLLIERVLAFAGREVWNIMTPRTKTVAVDQNMPIKEVVKLFKKTRFSKLPVYEETDDNLVGVIYLRDIFQYVHNPDKPGDKKAGDIMESMYFVPETKRLSEMLEDFRSKKIRIAAVIDEYGSALGIVTIADVLGEIVGELMDESFTVENKVVRITKDRFMVSGDISLADVNAYFETDIESEEYETLAGYVIEKAGDIPEKGFGLDTGDYRIIVQERSEKHIELFLVERL